MAFDVEKLTEFALRAIADFAAQHQAETFYAFAFDECLLCLNSIERFEENLATFHMQLKPSPDADWYFTDEGVAYIKENTGNWPYQGFAKFNTEHGFDFEAYDEHYNIGLDDPEDERLTTSEYARAMDSVLHRLVARKAFDGLKKSDDFRAIRVEHSY